MKQKSFLSSLLIKAASFFSVIFFMVGLLFLYASYFGGSNQLVGLILVSVGGFLAIVSLIVTNISVNSMQSELKDSYQLAHQISQGDIFTSIHEDDAEENSELKSLLRQIGVYLKEKSAIADQIATGDLTAEIELRSEDDLFDLQTTSNFCWWFDERFRIQYSTVGKAISTLTPRASQKSKITIEKKT